MIEGAIATQRLTLDEFRVSDAVPLNVLRNDAEVRRYLEVKPRETLEETVRIMARFEEDHAAGRGLHHAIRERPAAAAIGYVGVWRFDCDSGVGDLGYLLSPAYWNRGFMTEALTAFLSSAARRLPLRGLVASVHPRNVYSARLLERLEFRESGQDEGSGVVVFRRRWDP